MAEVTISKEKMDFTIDLLITIRKQGFGAMAHRILQNCIWRKSPKSNCKLHLVVNNSYENWAIAADRDAVVARFFVEEKKICWCF